MMRQQVPWPLAAAPPGYPILESQRLLQPQLIPQESPPPRKELGARGRASVAPQLFPPPPQSQVPQPDLR